MKVFGKHQSVIQLFSYSIIMNEEDKIELRSEEFQEVLGSIPHWILRWGITLIAIIVALFLIACVVIKYPDIIPSRIVLTGSIPPATITARTSGKLNQLFVQDNQTVCAGNYLAVINNPAYTENIIMLKEYLERFDINTDPLILPDKDLQVGNLQTTYSSFYITLFDYMEYKRLLYFPQKIRMIAERIGQYEEQYRSLQRQQTLTKEQFFLTQNQYWRDSVLYSTGIISKEELEKSQNSYLQSKLKELLYLPNMQGQADIITEDISLLERFISPLKRILSESI